MLISASVRSAPSMRTVPTVTSIVSGLPGVSGMTRLCRSVSSAPMRSAAARTIHTRALYFPHMRHMASAARAGWVATLALVFAARTAAAQVLPEQPISLADGHVVLGAEFSFTFAPEDPG